MALEPSGDPWRPVETRVELRGSGRSFAVFGFWSAPGACYAVEYVGAPQALDRQRRNTPVDASGDVAMSDASPPQPAEQSSPPGGSPPAPLDRLKRATAPGNLAARFVRSMRTLQVGWSHRAAER